MQEMLNNFINGNLKEAREQARRFNLISIAMSLEEQCGYSKLKAGRVSVWLKTGRGWQEACDTP